MEEYRHCTLCPRRCGADRLAGQRGFCGADAHLRAARAAAHFWEEPCISGAKGSGTVFFSHCNLRCVFCQNYSISTEGQGMEIGIDALAQVFLRLQEQGCHNINLVTPTVWTPHIRAALLEAKQKGLHLPVVYNCGGYESGEVIRRMGDVVDIWMPDFKYHSESLAQKYSSAPHYAETALQAVGEMFSLAGAPRYDGDGMMQSGVIVRHMLLPGALFDTKAVLRLLFENFGNDVVYSIMSQYTPTEKVQGFPELARTVRCGSYEKAVEYALCLGIRNAYTQQMGSVGESFIPNFDGEGLC